MIEDRPQKATKVAPLAAVNDFVVKFANINGSGSASANGMFAKAVLRMGVPVAARNIFPSNIQGLPTWYEVRVTADGWLGRRGGVDLMVAMNPQTFAKDVASIEPGGYLFYDSTKPLPHGLREDVNVLGLPLTAICNAAYSDPRQRQLFKNIIYVGALAEILGIPAEVTDTLAAEEFASKPKLIDANLAALAMGRRHARDHLDPLPLRVRRSDGVGERIYVQGNEAAALGAVFGGATVCAWYPITPSTSLAEAFMAHCKRYRTEPETGASRYAILQAEDEIAAIGIVLGAGWNGARAFTCTSGPGISLMQEFLGLSYYAEVPAVVFDVQRGGPSTGMPTRTQQADLLLAAYASHGDTKHPMLFPQDPAECFEFGALAFDLADRLQTAVFVMLDLDIGMNEWLCAPLKWQDGRRLDRGKVMGPQDLEAASSFGRYRDVDGDGIPYRTIPGVHPTLGAYFTRGSSHDAEARYSEEGHLYVANMQRIVRKFETAKTLVPGPEIRTAAKRTPHAVVYFGSTSAAMDESLASLAEAGIGLDALRVRGFPFCDEVIDFIAAHETVFLVEQNRDAQLRSLIMIEGGVDPAKLVPVLSFDGSPITARFITEAIAERLVSPAAARAPGAKA
ncbi:MAG TPA: 2-oxoacid:acceptor oxidoreductase subunit alpha [Caulobacteraceae bacterium]|nr:2-oxoacid:acceptor oxidoreductase subunit alpha [Caulobacteraceae bacterium]